MKDSETIQDKINAGTKRLIAQMRELENQPVDYTLPFKGLLSQLTTEQNVKCVTQFEIEEAFDLMHSQGGTK